MRNTVLIAASYLLLASPAYAEVKTSSDTGFNIIHIATVQGSTDEIWKRLVAPKDWWNKSHSWSGSTDGFYIDAQANGCFCELFQEKGPDGKLKTVGSVEHMRVIFAQPGKVLRMQGGLGPLQSEAVTGTLTVAMEPSKDGQETKISFSYVVGGYMRYKVSEIAPAVDNVLGDQFRRLLKPFAPVSNEAESAEGFSLDVEKLEDDAPVVEDAKAEDPKDEGEASDDQASAPQ
jgi:hypothetical protein